MIGTCYLITDSNMIQQAAYNSRIVCVTEGNPFGHSLPVVEASVLMPPYQAMVAQIDGDMNKFVAEYMMYLRSTEAVNTLIAIIGRGLLTGINISIYIPADEANLFADVLLQYMADAYGIMVGTQKRQFMLMPFAYIPINTTCYMTDTITLDVFLAECPRDLNLFANIAAKVGIDYDLFYDLNGIIEYTALLWDQQHLNGKLLKRVTPIVFAADKP